jgi:hypothetical protein
LRVLARLILWPRTRWCQVLIVLAGCLGVVLVERTSRADLIYFRKGGDAQLPATVEGNRVVLAMPEGKIELFREDLVKLVPGFWPGTEWESHRREARAGGFAARYAAVWWAMENGLTTEAAAELRELHAMDPKHGPTARMVALLDRLDRPCDDPEMAGFRAALGIETKVARGPHVVLLHQHSEAEAGERVALLERVLAGFHLLFAAQGIELRVPRHRLVSAWFADRKDYLAFLHQQDADAFVTTSGYFHPTWDAVVAYDARSGEKQRAAREALAARREELRRLAEAIDRMPARGRLRVKLADEPARGVGRAEGQAIIDRLEREAAYRTALLDLDWRAIDLGTAAHEMIHQLAADSGLVPRHDAFSYWMHEGFAAQFEVIRGGRWAGISRAHDLRLPDWRKIQTPVGLERLVRDAGFGRGYQRDLYAQAWALVYYLRTQRPQQFLTFIDLLRNPDADSDGGAMLQGARGERVFNAFRRSFGPDLDGLERDWHRFMAGVQTPLEQYAPTSSPASKPGLIESKTRPPMPPTIRSEN